MTSLFRYLWLFPLTVHAAYFAATFRFIPDRLGPDQSASVSRLFFSLEWLTIVLFSNVLLFAFWKRMPRFSDRTLSVPNREHWLKTPECRSELIMRLQNLLETVLVLINIFFLGIYQWVYQSNVLTPVIRLPFILLIAGFVTFPMALIVVYLVSLMKTLKHPDSPK